MSWFLVGLLVGWATWFVPALAIVLVVERARERGDVLGGGK